MEESFATSDGYVTKQLNEAKKQQKNQNKSDGSKW